MRIFKHKISLSKLQAPTEVRIIIVYGGCQVRVVPIPPHLSTVVCYIIEVLGDGGDIYAVHRVTTAMTATIRHEVTVIITTATTTTGNTVTIAAGNTYFIILRTATTTSADPIG